MVKIVLIKAGYLQPLVSLVTPRQEVLPQGQDWLRGAPAIAFLLPLTDRAMPHLEDRIDVLSRWSFPHQVNRGKSINGTWNAYANQFTAWAKMLVAAIAKIAITTGHQRVNGRLLSGKRAG